MKVASALALLLGLAVMGAAAQAGAQEPIHHYKTRGAARQAVDGRRPAAQPTKPNAQSHGGNDEDDGLSRNPDKCDTGCIGGNPD